MISAVTSIEKPIAEWGYIVDVDGDAPRFVRRPHLGLHRLGYAVQRVEIAGGRLRKAARATLPMKRRDQ
jgi:hypothetical protein